MRTLVLIAALACAAPAYAYDAAAPAAFKFGEGADAHDFSAACSSYEVRTLDPALTPLAQESHVQVDCQGFAYFGAPRLAEFVFADGVLTHVWVLTEAADLPQMRAAFEAAFGPPSHETDDFAAFADHHAVIRSDRPEALYYSPAAAPAFAAWFDEQMRE